MNSDCRANMSVLRKYVQVSFRINNTLQRAKYSEVYMISIKYFIGKGYAHVLDYKQLYFKKQD